MNHYLVSHFVSTAKHEVPASGLVVSKAVRKETTLANPMASVSLPKHLPTRRGSPIRRELIQFFLQESFKAGTAFEIGKATGYEVAPANALAIALYTRVGSFIYSMTLH